MVIENASRRRANASQSDRFLGPEVLISNISHVYSQLILIPTLTIARKSVIRVTIDNIQNIISNITVFVTPSTPARSLTPACKGSPMWDPLGRGVATL